MSLFLAGGGDREDSFLLDQAFCSTLEGQRRVLYWPIAMDGSGPSYPECLNWIKETLARFDCTAIEMWTDLRGHAVEELSNFDGLYIGGGNTFRLLREVRANNWFEPLVAAASSGYPIYGGSAGAILMGQSILTSQDPNDQPEVPLDTAGLGLLGGLSVACHYRASREEEIRGYVKRIKGPVVAIPEGAGIKKIGDELKVVGPQAVVLFGDGPLRRVRAGDYV